MNSHPNLQPWIGQNRHSFGCHSQLVLLQIQGYKQIIWTDFRKFQPTIIIFARKFQTWRSPFLSITSFIVSACIFNREDICESWSGRFHYIHIHICVRRLSKQVCKFHFYTSEHFQMPSSFTVELNMACIDVGWINLSKIKI